MSGTRTGPTPNRIRCRSRRSAGSPGISNSGWWSATIDHLSGRTPRNRSDVAWAGSGAAAVADIRALAAQWRELLAGLAGDELERPSAFPWGPDTGHTVAHTALWVNVELTKNIAEIGQLRLIRAAGASL